MMTPVPALPDILVLNVKPTGVTTDPSPTPSCAPPTEPASPRTTVPALPDTPTWIVRFPPVSVNYLQVKESVLDLEIVHQSINVNVNRDIIHPIVP